MDAVMEGGGGQECLLDIRGQWRKLVESKRVLCVRYMVSYWPVATTQRLEPIRNNEGVRRRSSAPG